MEGVHLATPISTTVTAPTTPPVDATHASQCIYLACVERIPSHTCCTCAVNPNDFENVGQKKTKELHFDARFEGITLHVAHQGSEVAYAHVSGQTTLLCDVPYGGTSDKGHSE